MSIVTTKLGETAKLVKQYNQKYGTKLTINDATYQALINDEDVPIFEYNNEKIGITSFSKFLYDVGDMKLVNKGDNNYRIIGKKRIGWNNSDKWNPKPILEDFSIDFKGYNIENILKDRFNISVLKK